MLQVNRRVLVRCKAKGGISLASASRRLCQIADASSPASRRAAKFSEVKHAVAIRAPSPARVSFKNDGSIADVDSTWRPVLALKELGDGGADPFVAASVDGVVVGLTDCLHDVLPSAQTAGGLPVKVELLRFSSVEGKKVFWHSSAHLLGAALEAELGQNVHLCDGPPLLAAEGGFFYEMHVDGAAAAAAAVAKAPQVSAPASSSAQAVSGEAGGPSSSALPLSGLSHVAAGRGGSSLTEGIIAGLEKRMKALAKDRLPFERLVVTAEQAAAVFAEAPFKLDLLARIPAGEPISLYRCGPFVDLCRGPHLPHSGYVKALALHRVSGAHWSGAAGRPLPASVQAAVDETLAGIDRSVPRGISGGGAGIDRANPAAVGLRSIPSGPVLLQRVYGVAFPAPAGLAAWKDTIEEARKRDHRTIGAKQELFFFHEMSPGSAFFLPHGTRIYNRLVSLLRDEYRRRGYEEVRSPLMYRRELWETSGHLAAYAENMYTVTPGLAPLHHHKPAPAAASAPASAAGPASASPAAVAAIGGSGLHEKTHEHSHCCSHGHDEDGDGEPEEVFGLKPMNCPGHCLIFKHRSVSYRDLPLRLADFSTLHRNEASGALGGLTRLRRFSQDDAHVFCAPEQVGAEVAGCLAFIAHIYRLFGFSFRAKLSTRPDTFVGDLETWTAAEAALASSLRAFLLPPSSYPSPSASSSALPALNAAAAAGTGAEPATNGLKGELQQTQKEPEHGQAAEQPFEVDAGGGAFYGPKIDVFVRDAIGREHQCATVQLDFNLPRRFGLAYTDSSGSGRTPVMIHRAILGSVERMLGILIEHTGGRWPLWLSPRQVLVASVSERNAGYARSVESALLAPPAPGEFAGAAGSTAAAVSAADATAVAAPESSAATAATAATAGVLHASASQASLYVDVDASSRTIPKKVRDAQVAQYNVIAVVGDAEQRDGTLTLRFRDAATHAAFAATAAEEGISLAPTAAAPAAPASSAASGASDATVASNVPASAPKQPAKGQKGQSQKGSSVDSGSGAVKAADMPAEPPVVCLPLPLARRVLYRMCERLR